MCGANWHSRQSFSQRNWTKLLGRKSEAQLESEFVVVQGVADLVVLLPKEIWLVDFKTDDVYKSGIAGENQNLFAAVEALRPRAGENLFASGEEMLAAFFITAPFRAGRLKLARPPGVGNFCVERIDGGRRQSGGDGFEFFGVLRQGEQRGVVFSLPDQNVAASGQILRTQPFLRVFQDDIIHPVIADELVPIRAAFFIKSVVQVERGFGIRRFVAAVHGNFDARIKTPKTIAAPAERRRKISLRLGARQNVCFAHGCMADGRQHVKRRLRQKFGGDENGERAVDNCHDERRAEIFLRAG